MCNRWKDNWDSLNQGRSLIAILDYGSGNLRSAERAFALADPNTVVTKDPKICAEADGLVVPGVGAFASCMTQLIDAGGREIIANRLSAKKPLFGICVGMQILFTDSDEKGQSKGLNILPGRVTQICAAVLPHIGWNTVKTENGSKLFSRVEDSSFYFVHSYAAKAKVPGAINTITNYGEDFLAAVEFENVVATQFHPEKSGDAGAKLIANWVAGL
jgi:imidazole glycerol-phosphate synthase subunit HisH